MNPSQINSTGVADAVLELFAMRAVEDLDLAEYVAGEPAEARHTLLTNSGAYRVLLRGEPAAWCDGLASAAGYPQLIPDLAARPVPKVLTLAQAAQLLPSLADPDAALSTYGAKNAAQTLYPLYAANLLSRGRQRYLFELEVRAVAAERRLTVAERGTERRPRARLSKAAAAAREEWLALRRQLPTPIREHMAEVDLAPAASPDPLPLDPDRLSASALCLDGLTIAHQEGWLVYRHPTGEGRAYAVQLETPDGPVSREIPQERVLPWLLGVADWHGRPELVAYRPGLG